MNDLEGFDVGQLFISSEDGHLYEIIDIKNGVLFTEVVTTKHTALVFCDDGTVDISSYEVM